MRLMCGSDASLRCTDYSRGDSRSHNTPIYTVYDGTHIIRAAYYYSAQTQLCVQHVTRAAQCIQYDTERDPLSNNDR